MERWEPLEAVTRRTQVDPTTARRWCQRGQAYAKRTPSGHWRIRVDADGWPMAARKPKFNGRPRAKGAR